MADFTLPNLPPVIPPNVQRYSADGKPVTVQITYETQLQAWLQAVNDQTIAGANYTTATKTAVDAILAALGPLSTEGA